MDKIIEQLKSVVSPEMLDTITQAVDEPKENVIKALDALFPVLIGGVIKREDEDPNSGIIEHLTNLLKEQALWDGGSITTDYIGIRNILLGEGEQAHQSARFIALIFGDKIEELTTSIANYAGIKIGSAYSLTILAGTLVIAVLTKNAFDNNFLPTALLKSLQTQKNHILAAAPLCLLGTLGLDKHETLVAKAEDIAVDLRKNNIVKIIILILALLIIAFLLLRGCASSVKSPTTTSTHHTKKTAKSNWEDLGEMKHTKLPNGAKIHVPDHGVENKLLAFIEDPSKMPDSSTWFTFDRLGFTTGSAVLSPESTPQLESIAQILKSFPAVYILVGGFTDDTGPDEINNPLSDERAKAVKNHLVALGVSANRIDIKGFGETQPLETNKTAEGRARNRQSGILVLQK